MFAKKILSKKRFLSAMAGVAMLALPVSAFAGHHDHWDHPRPNAWHDQGWHKGWMKHQWAHGGQYGTPAQRAYGWNNGYGRECDEDGDRCGWGANAPAPAYQPNYGYNPGVWTGDEDDDNEARAYPSYLQPSPAGSAPSQSLSWLMAKRQRTMATIARLRARHDARGAARLVPTVTALNRRIGRLNNRLGYSGNYGYAPATGYMAPANSPFNSVPYNPPIPYNSANPYSGTGYYNAPYTGNPTMDALTAIAVPMLSGVR